LNWQQKASVFRLLESMPGRDRIHYLLQKHVTKSIPRPTKEYPRYMRDSLAQIQALKHSDALPEGMYFEFGAGWDLFHNMILYCFGVERQLLVDLTPHMHPELVNDVIANLQRNPPHGALRLPRHRLTDRPLDDLQDQYGITYLAPADARSVPLESATVTMAGTTNTLEHIPFADLAAIIRELRRLCAGNARVAMQVDYSDHYSHSDRNITPYNFLRYSDIEWRRYNTTSHYQNRRRHSDYRALFLANGFRIEKEELQRPDDWEAQLDSVPVHRDFHSYEKSDLGTTSATFSLLPG
jgi:hypothetical protein